MFISPLYLLEEDMATLLVIGYSGLFTIVIININFLPPSPSS